MSKHVDSFNNLSEKFEKFSKPNEVQSKLKEWTHVKLTQKKENKNNFLL